MSTTPATLDTRHPRPPAVLLDHASRRPPPPASVKSLRALLAGLLLVSPGPGDTSSRLLATPVDGPPLDSRFLRPPAEPPGPSSRRSGVTISEIMYHPAPHPAGLDLAFIEIYNSLPWFEDISGWKITGDVEFQFPNNTVLPSQARAIIATTPAYFSGSLGLTNVFGPFAGGKSLSPSKGRIELRNRAGAINAEVPYDDDDPWPVAPDGGGPSLVLARPSLGEGNPRAWSASSRVGGSPLEPEPAPAAGFRGVVINEILARPAAGQREFVELFNYSSEPADLSGCFLTDDPDDRGFTFPEGTILPSLGHLAIDEEHLGFGLSSEGEKLFLYNPARDQVLDALRYDPQSTGIGTGRHPDGSPRLTRLTRPTPGTTNAPPRLPPLVLNEILFHPPAESAQPEFIEIHNPGSNAVEVSGLRLSGGINFTLNAPTRVAAAGYLVVTADPGRLLGARPELSAASVAGPWEGTLRNRNERVVLSLAEITSTTNRNGRVTSTTNWIPIEAVEYAGGGRWGRWADGGGSSLERIHPATDPALAPNWADSDETGKSSWTTVEATGRPDQANGNADSLEIILYGPGECLIDGVEVLGPGNTNRVLNGSFEAGTNGWSFQGNHAYARLENQGAHDGTNCLRLRTTGPGHTGPNRIRAAFRPNLSTTQSATIRARVRWLAGSAQILVRLHGNGLEAPASILATSALGTPGAPNSRATSNAPPAITEVQHHPVLPPAGAPVLVVARIDDTDSIRDVQLSWRRDPSPTPTLVPMTHRGAGLYAAEIPGQSTGTLVAFSIIATDDAPTPASARFPSDAPARECLVRWGETNPNSRLGVYRLWITRATADRWTRREKLSNDPLDATFVCADYRAIYNAGALYSGSPFHAPSYAGPTSGNCDYVVILPQDDRFLGDDELNLLQPGNGGGDATCQQEQHAYWIARELGIPFCHRRSTLLYVNGVRRGSTYDDAQQPNGDFIKQWYPDDSDGDLHKIQFWFEFDPTGATFNFVPAALGQYNSGGRKKLARYRWNWPRRAADADVNNFTNLFRLVDAVNNTLTGRPYIQSVEREVDVDQWFRTHVVEHLVNNVDSFSLGGGQNMYTYRPARDRWKLLIWDIDFAFNDTNPGTDLFNIGGRDHGPVNTEGAFRRLYFQALIDAANGPLVTNRSNAILDARYQAFRSNGAGSAGSPAAIKTFVARRRDFVLSQIRRADAILQFRTNEGQPIDSLTPSVTLTGTAPLALGRLTLNGRPFDVFWNTATTWTGTTDLAPGTNTLVLAGILPNGAPATNPPVTFTAIFHADGAVPPPQLLPLEPGTVPPVLLWRAVPSQAYLVEESPTLAPPAWTPHRIVVPPNTYQGSFVPGTTGDRARFFRVRVQP